MRALRWVLVGVAIFATGLWVAAYAYVGAMGRAFVTSSPPGGCRIDMPWDLRGEDLMLFVLIPGAVVLALWTIAIIIWRRSTKSPNP